MSFSLPSGPWTFTRQEQEMEVLKEKGQLPPGIEPPPEVTEPPEESQADKLAKQGSYYFGLDD